MRSAGVWPTSTTWILLTLVFFALLMHCYLYALLELVVLEAPLGYVVGELMEL